YKIEPRSGIVAGVGRSEDPANALSVGLPVEFEPIVGDFWGSAINDQRASIFESGFESGTEGSGLTDPCSPGSRGDGTTRFRPGPCPHHQPNHCGGQQSQFP